MNMWQKLRVLPFVWRNMLPILDAATLALQAREHLERQDRWATSCAQLLQEQQNTIKQLNQMTAEDALLLLAFSRWCTARGCPPSMAELASMISQESPTCH